MTIDHTPVRVGIAGLGRSGWDIHCRLLAQLPDKYRIVAVADHIEARRNEAEQRFGCRAYEEFDALVADPEVDLVVVALPSYLHAGSAMRSLKAGKATITEKPMATSLADADAMLQVARETGKPLFIFQNKRYSPDFQAVKRVIDSGVLGRPVQIRIAYHAFKRRWDWQTLKEFGGGTLNNNGTHPVDQALTLLAGKTPDVRCERARILSLGDADDHVRITLAAEDSPTIEIEVTDAVAFPQPRWHVVGTRGGLTGSATELKWRYVRQQEFPPREVDTRSTPDRSYNREELVWHEDSWSAERATGPGELGYYLDLYETLTTGKPPVIDPELVRLQMWVLEECRRQAPV
jgi:predicted dehydrogenase